MRPSDSAGSRAAPAAAPSLSCERKPSRFVPAPPRQRSAAVDMIKLFSLKQQKEEEGAPRPHHHKRASAAHLRITKGLAHWQLSARPAPCQSRYLSFRLVCVIVTFVGRVRSVRGFVVMSRDFFACVFVARFVRSRWPEFRKILWFVDLYVENCTRLILFGNIHSSLESLCMKVI